MSDWSKISHVEKDIEKELEQEYNRFIEFGHVLDRKMRTYIVQYLQNKFDPDRHLLPELNEKYFDYFQKALDRIFEIEGLLDLTQVNPLLKKQVVFDLIYWFKKAYKKVREKNPFEDEKLRLQGWAVTPFAIFVNRWPTLPGYLNSVYDRAELDYAFFQNRFSTLIDGRPDNQFSNAEKEKIELLIHDLLAQWDALLNAKILQYQLSKFEEEEEHYVDLLNRKVKEYNRIREYINPFSSYLGWDLSRKLWQESSFDILNHYDDLLQEEQSIKALADLLGNMREAEIETEEETFEKTIIRQEWVSDETAKAEIVGVRESDDISHLLSSEVLLLSEPQTELLFLKKYADKKINDFQI